MAVPVPLSGGSTSYENAVPFFCCKSCVTFIAFLLFPRVVFSFLRVASGIATCGIKFFTGSRIGRSPSFWL